MELPANEAGLRLGLPQAAREGFKFDVGTRAGCPVGAAQQALVITVAGAAAINGIDTRAAEFSGGSGTGWGGVAGFARTRGMTRWFFTGENPE